MPPSRETNDSFYWQPGVTLPSPIPLTTPSSRRRNSSQAPRVNLNPSFSSESDSEPTGNETASLQGTLKAILLSQETLQKQMESVLHRVNDLEESIKVTSHSLSSGSSSDEKKRKQRLSSDLCVSALFICD